MSPRPAAAGVSNGAAAEDLVCPDLARGRIAPLASEIHRPHARLGQLTV
jgi:hypothetical protein